MSNARPRRVSLRLAALAAISAAALTVTVSGGHSALAGLAGHTHNQDRNHATGAQGRLNPRQLAFHDQMRKLWEDHITWTRLAIISFAEELPDFEATASRLLQNQADIGNAIKPFYGADAAQELTMLLKEHITGAVAVLEAAKSGDNAAFEQAKEAWYRNADQIARFLNEANPRNWKFEAVDQMMHTHLDQTLQEAADRLAGNFSADIDDYEAVHLHILEMADFLSNGIMAQFPAKFR